MSNRFTHMSSVGQFKFVPPESCPVFHPSEEEFQNPMTYIKKIKEVGEQYGICKIIPPEGWVPPFAIDVHSFTFGTRIQRLNELEGSSRLKVTFFDSLKEFCDMRGIRLEKIPRLGRVYLDLYKLNKEVLKRGGYYAVCRSTQWATIGKSLGLSRDKGCTSMSFALRTKYEKLLLPYDLFRAHSGDERCAKVYDIKVYGGGSDSGAKASRNSNGADVNANGESGGESIDTSASNHKRIKLDSDVEKDRATLKLKSEKETGEAQMSANDGDVDMKNDDETDEEEIKEEDGESYREEEEEEKEEEEEEEEKDSSSSDDDTIAARRRKMGRRQAAKKADADRKNMEVNAYEGINFRAKNTTARGGYVSKKKRATMKSKAGKGMDVPYMPPSVRMEDLVCIKCSGDYEKELLVVCAKCVKAFHLGCAAPPLTEIPVTQWVCFDCLSEIHRMPTTAYGFDDGNSYTLYEFFNHCENFKLNHFIARGLVPEDTMYARDIPTSVVEQEFWRLTTALDECVEVEYGADLHSNKHGSGFPRNEGEMKLAHGLAQSYIDEDGKQEQLNHPNFGFTKKYRHLNGKSDFVKDPWNLNNLPVLPESLLSYIEADISGMMVPWVYVGMVFSSFAWHNEDHYTYSINYNHLGEPKTWYGVPGAQAGKLEAAMRKKAPDLFEEQPDLLHQLTTLMSPKDLLAEGVKVCRADQHQGEFIVTFPAAFHGGFNQGFNVCEAVNFATEDWISWGLLSIDHYRRVKRFPVFSHDELMVNSITNGVDQCDLEVCVTMHEEMKRILAAFKEFQRNAIPMCKESYDAEQERDGERVTCGERTMFDAMSDDDRKCGICNNSCYLGAIQCECSPDVYICHRDVLQKEVDGFVAIPKSQQVPTEAVHTISEQTSLPVPATEGPAGKMVPAGKMATTMHGSSSGVKKNDARVGLCHCDRNKKTILYRHTVEEYENFIQKVEKRIAYFTEWTRGHGDSRLRDLISSQQKMDPSGPDCVSKVSFIPFEDRLTLAEVKHHLDLAREHCLSERMPQVAGLQELYRSCEELQSECVKLIVRKKYGVRNSSNGAGYVTSTGRQSNNAGGGAIDVSRVEELNERVMKCPVYFPEIEDLKAVMETIGDFRAQLRVALGTNLRTKDNGKKGMSLLSRLRVENGHECPEHSDSESMCDVEKGDMPVEDLEKLLDIIPMSIDFQLPEEEDARRLIKIQRWVIEADELLQYRDKRMREVAEENNRMDEEQQKRSLLSLRRLDSSCSDMSFSSKFYKNVSDYAQEDLDQLIGEGRVMVHESFISKCSYSHQLEYFDNWEYRGGIVWEKLAGLLEISNDVGAWNKSASDLRKEIDTQSGKTPIGKLRACVRNGAALPVLPKNFENVSQPLNDAENLIHKMNLFKDNVERLEKSMELAFHRRLEGKNVDDEIDWTAQNNKMSQHEVQKLFNALLHSPIAITDKIVIVKNAHNNASHLRARIERIFLKKGSKDVVKALKGRSSDAEIRKLLAQVYKRREVNASRNEAQKYCVCNEESYGFMVECELCEDWFHSKCVGYRRPSVAETRYFCPSCRHTLRPNFDVFEQVVTDSVRSLNVALPEGPSLESLLVCARKWRCDVTNLHNSAEMLEIMRSTAWVDAEVGKCVQGGQSSVADASTLHDVDPATLSDLTNVIERGQELLAYGDCIELDMKETQILLDDLKCLTQRLMFLKGESLLDDQDDKAASAAGGRVGRNHRLFFQRHKQSSLASAASTPPRAFCICRQPAKDAAKDPRLMIQCESCIDWFHAQCVKLKEEEAAAIPHYNCPQCTKYNAGRSLCICGMRVVNDREQDDLESDSSFFILCDTCEEWFHGDCVGVREEDGNKMNTYMCPRCEKDRNNSLYGGISSSSSVMAN
eukprot:Nk52_evm10s559 gene=Nk52_evmTU10s559